MSYDEDTTYCIKRFTFDQPTEIIRTGLTLEEAQEHCNDESTHDMDATPPWFDGYDIDG